MSVNNSDDARKLAAQIADDLFTNGSGERAERLVLEMENGRDGGGWCYGAIVDRIEGLAALHHNNQPAQDKNDANN